MHREEREGVFLDGRIQWGVADVLIGTVVSIRAGPKLWLHQDEGVLKDDWARASHQSHSQQMHLSVGSLLGPLHLRLLHNRCGQVVHRPATWNFPCGTVMQRMLTIFDPSPEDVWRWLPQEGESQFWG